MGPWPAGAYLIDVYSTFGAASAYNHGWFGLNPKGMGIALLEPVIRGCVCTLLAILTAGQEEVPAGPWTYSTLIVILSVRAT
jgi:hypothetical protein